VEITTMTTANYHPFRARLDATAARTIRARVRAGVPPRALATEYAVAASSIYDVVAGRSYPPRVVIETDDETLDALVQLARQAGHPLERFIADSLRALVAPGQTTT
jgi:hypothetical protein